MFVFSVKTTKKQLITSAVCVAAMIVLAIAAAATSTPIRSTSGTPMGSTFTTDTDRVGYLNSLGYETVSEPTKVQEIRLPDEADSVLQEYNTLLQQVGMDLEPYYGKRVKCYSYQVLNHADGDAVAHLYVYRDKLVAGHIETAKGQQLLAAQSKPE